MSRFMWKLQEGGLESPNFRDALLKEINELQDN